MDGAARHRQIGWIVGALVMGAVGVGAIFAWTKPIHDAGMRSFDTTGSRAGIALVSTAFIVCFVSLVGLPRWIRTWGMVAITALTLAAAIVLVRAPQVPVTSARYGDAMHNCGETTALHALGWAEDYRGRASFRVTGDSCHENARRLFLGAVAGSIVGCIVVGAVSRRRPNRPDLTLSTGSTTSQ